MEQQVWNDTDKLKFYPGVPTQHCHCVRTMVPKRGTFHMFLEFSRTKSSEIVKIRGVSSARKILKRVYLDQLSEKC